MLAASGVDVVAIIVKVFEPWVGALGRVVGIRVRGVHEGCEGERRPGRTAIEVVIIAQGEPMVPLPLQRSEFVADRLDCDCGISGSCVGAIRRTVAFDRSIA